MIPKIGIFLNTFSSVIPGKYNALYFLRLLLEISVVDNHNGVLQFCFAGYEPALCWGENAFISSFYHGEGLYFKRRLFVWCFSNELWKQLWNSSSRAFPNLRIWCDNALALVLTALQALCTIQSTRWLWSHFNWPWRDVQNRRSLPGGCSERGWAALRELPSWWCRSLWKGWQPEKIRLDSGQLWFMWKDYTNKCAASPLASQGVGRSVHSELVCSQTGLQF